MTFNIVISTIVFIGSLIIGYQIYMLHGKVITNGKVIDLPSSRGSKGGTVYSIVAEFKTVGGAPYVYKSGWSSSDPGYVEGDSIKIFYDATDPNKNGICSFGARFGIGFCVIIIAVLLLSFKFGWPLAEKAFDVCYPFNDKCEVSE